MTTREQQIKDVEGIINNVPITDGVEHYKIGKEASRDLATAIVDHWKKKGYMTFEYVKKKRRGG